MNLIPIYALLFVPARIALAGDQKRFLERSAKIQMGLYLCVYALEPRARVARSEAESWQ